MLNLNDTLKRKYELWEWSKQSDKNVSQPAKQTWKKTTTIHLHPFFSLPHYSSVNCMGHFSQVNISVAYDIPGTPSEHLCCVPMCHTLC